MSGALELSRLGIESTLLPQLMPMLNQCDTSDVELAMLKCLLDPQTNGGLIVSVSADVGREIMNETNAVKIGEVCEAQGDAKILLSS
jgi:selenide,water dikinase